MVLDCFCVFLWFLVVLEISCQFSVVFDCFWFFVVLCRFFSGFFLWFMVVLGGCWGFLVILGGSWWFWWFLAVLCVSWWFSMDFDGS